MIENISNIQLLVKKDYDDTEFIKLMRDSIKSTIEQNKFYQKIVSKLGFKVDDLDKISDLEKVPFIPTNYFKESANLFRRLLKVPLESIKHWNISSCTSGDPSLVGVNDLDQEFLIEMSKKLYLDFIPRDWDNSKILCFSPSAKMLNRIVMRYTKIRPARAYTSNFYAVTKKMTKLTYLINFSILKAIKSIIMTRSLVGAFDINSSLVIKTLTNNLKKPEDKQKHIAIGGSVQLIKGFMKSLKERNISFNLGTKFDIVTGGGGWSGHKAQMKTDPVDKVEYVSDIIDTFGTEKSQIIDIYGFTETPIIFMGHWSDKYEDFIMHCPPYARILVRDTTDLNPITNGRGLLEVFTPFGNSASVNHTILIDDMVELISMNKCPECGYAGATFKLLGRITNKEGIGCSSLITWI
ncbi:MAG: LuxE/PaaK family acyltransferase [Candidatus Helarchaeota archaeon]